MTSSLMVGIAVIYVFIMLSALQKHQGMGMFYDFVCGYRSPRAVFGQHRSAQTIWRV